MTQHNFENDNKYHERSVQARKSTPCKRGG